MRNSCEALATNWRWASNEASSLREEIVEGVAELLELVVGSLEGETFVQVAGRDRARRRGDRAQTAQDATRDDPAKRDRDDRHDGQCDQRPEEEEVQVGASHALGDNVNLASLRLGLLRAEPAGMVTMAPPGTWKAVPLPEAAPRPIDPEACCLTATTEAPPA